MPDLFELLKELELRHVERLRPMMEVVPNRLVSAMLESIIHDSWKHAAITRRVTLLDRYETSYDEYLELAQKSCSSHP